MKTIGAIHSTLLAIPGSLAPLFAQGSTPKVPWRSMFQGNSFVETARGVATSLQWPNSFVKHGAKPVYPSRWFCTAPAILSVRQRLRQLATWRRS